MPKRDVSKRRPRLCLPERLIWNLKGRFHEKEAPIFMGRIKKNDLFSSSHVT